MILVDNMFRVLTKTIDPMGATEEFLIMGTIVRTMDSTKIHELESGVDELKNLAANVV